MRDPPSRWKDDPHAEPYPEEFRRDVVAVARSTRPAIATPFPVIPTLRPPAEDQPDDAQHHTDRGRDHDQRTHERGSPDGSANAADARPSRPPNRALRDSAGARGDASVTAPTRPADGHRVDRTRPRYGRFGRSAARRRDRTPGPGRVRRTPRAEGVPSAGRGTRSAMIVSAHLPPLPVVGRYSWPPCTVRHRSSRWSATLANVTVDVMPVTFERCPSVSSAVSLPSTAHPLPPHER
ncbi:conserved hypothetical protein (plasmid) [Rhodococcus jostii RHA1]|uniref:Uncharacterized protein n=1 Tax=Rhodococcus jostii (strain RHA1) TaxID=101510 RepID=Q0RX43_RHOJR|nr:conserved hypothetical protein [Rhodococcus jostii RHA1]